MLDNIDFRIIVLAELALILTVTASLTTVYAWKQRKLYKRVLEEYLKLRSNALNNKSVGSSSSDVNTDSHHNSNAHAGISEFLAQSKQEALDRFKSITQATLPRLAPDVPFGAKVAALRFLYSEAEAEVHANATSTHGKWMVLERKFADIVRWIGQDAKSQKPIRNNRLRLLQERIDALKPFEAENVRLQKQLNIVTKKQKRLEDFQAESGKTIASLQKIIRELQRASPIETGTTEQNKDKAKDSQPTSKHIEDDQFHEISRIADNKSSILHQISHELKVSLQDTSPDQQQKLASIITALEIELLKSDAQISKLKKSLKTDHSIPTFVFNNPDNDKKNNSHYLHSTPITDTKRADKSEFILRIANAINNPHADNHDREDGSELRKKTLAEIQQLRLNNQAQRNIIIDLEKELKRIKDKPQTSTLEPLKENDSKDIIRLERLVKECENCIETLENEVENLHEKLQNQQSPHNTPKTHTEKDNEDINYLNIELEKLSLKLQETAAQYHQTNIANNFTANIIKSNTIESIAREIAQAIINLEAIAGFSLQSKIGSAELFQKEYFSQKEITLAKKSIGKSNIGYLNEGVLLSNPYLGLLLKVDTRKKNNASNETTLANLINIAAERLSHLESEQKLNKQTKGLENWTTETRAHLTDLDIHYAFQSEESRRIIDNLIKELMRATEMVDMSSGARAVFDNAISECKNRTNIFLEGGKIMDRDFSQLFEVIDRFNVR